MTSLLEKFVERYGRLPTEVDPDYLEMLKMSKYYVVDRPAGSPGKCIGCGSTKIDGRRYVDLGAQIDWYGGVYLCGHCVKEAATNLGLFDEDRELIEKLREILKAKDDNLTEAIRLREVITKTAEEIKEYYGDIPVLMQSPDSDSNSAESDTVSPEAPTGSNSSSGNTAKTKQPVTRAKSGTSKSNSSTGREDIPSLAELLNSGSD